MSDAVVLTVEEHVATVTLNRPEQRNSMSAELLTTFAERIEQLKADRNVRCVVITGKDKSFCAGADISAMQQLAQRAGVDASVQRAAAIRAVYDAFLVVEQIEVPTIAAINGHAVGGGLGLALACDIRVVAERAKIGANFARLGIHPGMGISSRLPRLVGQERAALMLYTGELIRGAEAVGIGLCSQSAPADQVIDVARDLARRIAAAAPLAVRSIKRTLRQVAGMNDEAVLELESHAQAQLSHTADAAEGISALLSRREPSFEGK